MPHFAIESLGHGTGGFLDQIATSPLVTGLTGTRTVTGESFLTGIAVTGGVESGLSTRRILNRIQDIVDRNLLQSTQFQFENIFVPLGQLGQNQETLSSALNEQITIREEQSAKAFEAISNNQILQNSINEQLTKSLSDIGKSLGEGTGGFDFIKFFTDNPLIGGIGIGGLLVGGVVLFLVVR